MSDFAFLKSLFKSVSIKKAAAVLAACGIILIAASSFFQKSPKKATAALSDSTEDYRIKITAEAEKIVTGITGDKSPGVLITLKGGHSYRYLSNQSTDNADGRLSSRDDYVILKTADGETALLALKESPAISGVAVVCKGNADPAEIRNALSKGLCVDKENIYVGIKNN